MFQAEQVKNASSWELFSGITKSSSLMFIAFAGAARVATMGEEITEPRKTIPQSIILTVIMTGILYVTVAVVSIGLIGSDAFATASNHGLSQVLCINFFIYCDTLTRCLYDEDIPTGNSIIWNKKNGNN